MFYIIIEVYYSLTNRYCEASEFLELTWQAVRNKKEYRKILQGLYKTKSDDGVVFTVKRFLSKRKMKKEFLSRTNFNWRLR